MGIKDNLKKNSELTVKAVGLGIFLSIIMGAANVYLGLKSGMTISASIPASVLAVLLLRNLFSRSTVLEANQIQTAASAGESIAAGIVFTVPAMFLVTGLPEFNWMLTTAIAFSGGILGIVLMIPMRKVFISSGQKELIYPEGVACATVLKTAMIDSSSNSKQNQNSSLSILYGAGVGALSKFSITFLGLGKDTLEKSLAIWGKFFYIGVDTSAALIAVGFIVRLRVSLLILSGGLSAWFLALPFFEGSYIPDSPLSFVWTIWLDKIRYLGVGAMLVGGVTSVIKVRKSFIIAINVMKDKFLKNDEKDVEEKDRDLSYRIIIFLGLVSFSVSFFVYLKMTESFYISTITVFLMIILTFLSVAISSYMAGIVGSSNAPISGVIIGVLMISGSFLIIMGIVNQPGMIATLGVVSIVCCASATSNDIAQDLKTGKIVGASPYKQQAMQILGVIIASIIIPPILELLHNETPGGIGGKELSAPQAGLFSSMIQGVFGNSIIPWNLVGIGALVAIVIYIIDLYLESHGSEIRLYIMPIAIGVYLPLGLSIPMVLGAIIAYIMSKKSIFEKEEKLKGGTLFASGAIAGEALMGVGIAGLAAFGVPRIKLVNSSILLNIITFGFLLVIIISLILSTRSKKRN